MVPVNCYMNHMCYFKEPFHLFILIGHVTKRTQYHITAWHWSAKIYCMTYRVEVKVDGLGGKWTVQLGESGRSKTT